MKCRTLDEKISYFNQRVSEMPISRADKMEILGMLVAITADVVEVRQKPRWIPATERLPKGEAERYLVAADFMAHGLRVSIC